MILGAASEGYPQQAISIWKKTSQQVIHGNKRENTRGENLPYPRRARSGELCEYLRREIPSILPNKLAQDTLPLLAVLEMAARERDARKSRPIVRG